MHKHRAFAGQFDEETFSGLNLPWLIDNRYVNYLFDFIIIFFINIQ